MTGAKGFIGSHLKEYLEGQGHCVNNPTIGDDVDQVYHLSARITSSFNTTKPDVILRDNSVNSQFNGDSIYIHTIVDDEVPPTLEFTNVISSGYEHEVA